MNLVKFEEFKCRSCLSLIPYENLNPLFVKNENFSGMSFAELIMTCACVQVEENDMLPQHICNLCKDKLQTSYDFKKLCESSDQFLRYELNLSSANDYLEIGEDVLINKSAEDENKAEEKKTKIDTTLRLTKIRINKLKKPKRKRAPPTTFCRVCDIEFHEKKYLNNHIFEVHPSKVSCPACGKLFENYVKFNKHHYDTHIYTKKKHFKCLKCCQRFSVSSNLAKHLLTCGNKITNSQSPKEQVKSETENNDSNETNDTKMPKKLKSSNSKLNTLCYACNVDKGTWKAYCQHLRSEHPGKVRCFECGDLFLNYKLLMRHRRWAHRPKRQLKCPQCDKRFTKNWDLNVHLAKTHKKNDKSMDFYRKGYLCSTCGKKFTDRSNLTVHIRLHTGERPFKCQMCEKSFNSRKKLKSHNLTHSQEKRYCCDKCDQKFVHSYSLYTHKMKHDPSLNFVCDRCEHRYIDAKRLKEHYESVHLGIKHKCEECGKEFAYRKGLRRHEKKHKTDGEDVIKFVKKHKCEICGNEYACRDGLRRHQKKHRQPNENEMRPKTEFLYNYNNVNM